MIAWNSIAVLLLLVANTSALSTECDATRFDTCTLHLSDHIRQVPQQYAASADDVIQDTTTYASITVSEIEVNRMPNQLRNLLNLDKVTLKVKTNQTPTGTKTPSTEAVTTLKDVLSAMYQWHNIDELFTHLLQESPRVLGFHDLICQMLDHEGAAVLDKCMVEQPACVLGESSTGVEADDQLKQLVRTVKLARQSCHPGCEDITQQVEDISRNCSAYRSLKPLVTKRVRSSVDLPENLTCGTLQDATTCVHGNVGDCDVINEAYISFVDANMRSVMKDCGVDYKSISSDAADVWASHTAAAIVPVIVLRNTLAKSWLSATMMYGISMTIYYNVFW